MPRQYSMGGRAGPSAGAPGGLPPAPRSLRERFGALRNLPPFLKLIWRINPRIAVADLLLRLVRALLPVLTLYVGKLIIDEVISLVGAASPPTGLSGWLASGRL